ncbi:uncharacterized protein DMAD_02431 [Drosophila madeirensis]|uniref:Uncharacterized protein n=1 Tax=Drosophila madeirensis TaxID=30013 RepID=A0AAU9G5V5_DROMD
MDDNDCFYNAHNIGT